MMPTDRFERQLPELLTELANPRTPDYLDDLLWQTANTSQRPAWSLLERWLPMLDVVRQPVTAPPMPWRSIGLAFALLGLLLAMVSVLLVGNRPNPPAPFGPARNGLVAYASAGDIFTADPVTGVSTAIVGGPATDLNPQWSLDGTRIAFERKTKGDIGPGLLFVAETDGSNPILVTPEPLPGIDSYAFSPDGNQLLISAWPDGTPGILVAAADGGGTRQLALPGPATHGAWRPADGTEILFMDRGTVTSGFGGIYAVDAVSGNIRTVLEHEPGRNRGNAKWSPDGSQISYVEWVDATGITAQTHVMAADGTGDRVLPLPQGAVWQAPMSWSNDGTRLLAIRGYTGGSERALAVAVPADGSGFGVEFDSPGSINSLCCGWEWAPDDSYILGTPGDPLDRPLGQVLLHPATGTSKAVPWRATSNPTWQRLAPSR
jgi:dipeptidyl aminopeptidase/acylaminoacyl peptidase